MSFKLKKNSGNDFTHTMRLLHGDSPARHLESGQQKGGNFYCSGCGANAQQAYHLDICFSCHYLSLFDRQQLVLAGLPWKKKKSDKSSFQNLNKQELVQGLEEFMMGKKE
jgi:hypothetical protein